ncbi:MAG TPA: hypothetical protein VGO31_09085 [Microbacteriaceae bacterium]|jgi:hypothetical protein|nr:hypothetical protein [Microbacteriaceae bacterium]
MKPYAENVQTFAAMFEGYAGATSRFHEAAKTRDTTATFIPLFDALNWAVALDDRAAKHWTPAGEPLGFGWREKVRAAEVMRGVRFVRNSVHHQWSDALVLDETGLSFPITFPAVFMEWRWRAAGELPEPEPGRPRDDAGREVYQQMLEGQPARVTLETLAQAFYFLRQVMEPSSLRATPTPPIVTVVPSEPPSDPFYESE